MMDKHFVLRSSEFSEITLRTITESDLENLRIWKNTHRESFFFKGVISSTDQAKWFQGYLERIHDYMFVVVIEGRAIGCLAFRFIDGQVDIYNVILGVPEMGGKGIMSKAMRLVCSYAQEHYPGGQAAKVLRENPAVHWYQRNGFKTSRVHEDYVDVELDLGVFKPCLLSVSGMPGNMLVESKIRSTI